MLKLITVKIWIDKELIVILKIMIEKAWKLNKLNNVKNSSIKLRSSFNNITVIIKNTIEKAFILM